MGKAPGAQLFADAFQQVSARSENDARILGAFWTVLYRRHWPITMLSRDQWKIAVNDTLREYPCTASDLSAAIVALTDAEPALADALSKGMSFLSGRDGSNVIRNTLFGSYDDLVETFQAVITGAPGASLYNRDISATHGVWIMAYWTLVWMGLYHDDPFSVMRADVSFSSYGKCVAVKSGDGRIYSFEHPVAAEILLSAQQQEPYGNSKSREKLIAVSDTVIRQYTTRVNKALKAMNFRRKSVELIDVYQSGRFVRVGEVLANVGATSLPTSFEAVAKLGEFSYIPSAYNTRKGWYDRFLSWWDVFGNPDIQ